MIYIDIRQYINNVADLYGLNAILLTLVFGSVGSQTVALRKAFFLFYFMLPTDSFFHVDCSDNSESVSAEL